MRYFLLAVGVLPLLACVARTPADEQEEKTEQERQRREFVRQDTRQREANETAVVRANSARILTEGRQAQANAAAQQQDAKRNDCAESRDARAEELRTALARRKHVDDLQGWEHQHCKQVDASVAVRRVVQDAQGEYHTYEGRDRGVDRVCDAKLPTELTTHNADSLSAPAPAAALTNRECKASDIEASEVFRTFWAEGNPWMGRVAQTQAAQREAAEQRRNVQK